MVNLPGSKLAEYLLYNIAALEVIPDAFRGKLLQSRNIVLETFSQIFLRQSRKANDLICKSIH
jgi:hypothetical protein